MPKIQSKKKGRPRKSVSQRISEEKEEEKQLSQAISNKIEDIFTDAWEEEGGSIGPIDEEDIPKPLAEVLKPKTTLTANMLFRKKQWDGLDEFSKQRMRMTEEEFLEAEDVTGFGPNSYFTPREER